MIRWLRVVMPPWWAVAAAVFCYVGLEVFSLSAEWDLGLPFFTLIDGRTFVSVMGGIAVLYAVYRVWAFHPALRPAYCSWLAGTPWTSQKPLPLGPVHLVLQDLLILGVAVGLCWLRAGAEALAVLQAFLVCYLGLLAATHICTGQKGWAYAVAFGFGFMGLFALNPLFYAAAGITYVAALLGLRSSLAHFPWNETPLFQQLPQWLKAYSQSRHEESLGWPFDRLGPKFANDMHFTLGDTLLTGLLAGWWSFVVAYHLNTHGDIEDLANPSSFILICAVAGRISRYCHGYAPPLSLLGRVAHGRLIIPGYDQVFIAPLLAVLVYLAARALPLWNGIPEVFAFPIGVTATWWVLFGMGPSLNVWRLTGNHRIVKGVMMTLGQQSR